MIVTQRQQVIWLGDHAPEELQIAISNAGSQLVAASADAVDPARQNPRAILLPVSDANIGKFRGPFARLLVPTLDVGAAFILVVMDDTQAKTVSDAVMHLVHEKDSSAVDLHDVYPGCSIQRLHASELARIIRTSDPGLMANHNLHLQGFGTLEGERHRSAEILLRRAFSDCDRIALTSLDGGRSEDCSVWKVEAHRGNECCEPFVAKFAKRQTLEDENSTWNQHVLDFVPFPFRAPPVDERFVKGATYGLLVSRLASRSQRFDEYVGSVKSTELTIVSLLDGALRNWRRNTNAKDAQLGRIYALAADESEQTHQSHQRQGRIRKSILPGRTRLQDAYQLALKRDLQVPSPDALWQLLLDLPSIQYRECKAHGDLNARNVFVRWNAVDIILIDFSHAGDNGPLSRDPSRLEVSLAFDVATVSHKVKEEPEGKVTRTYVGSMLDDEALQLLYTPPLLRRQWGGNVEDGRTDAIRQIRVHVFGEGVSNAEYQITTACHLLNYARPGQKTASEIAGDGEAQRLRGLSYLLAARLLKHTRDLLTTA
jgi:hypothetical protein